MMLRRIDVSDVLRDHLRTLVDFRTGKRHWGDYTLFFALPAIISGLLLWNGIVCTTTIANIVITALSIFAGLLFNLLLLAHQLLRAAGGEPEERRLISEIYSNISYAILASILTIIASLVGYLSDEPLFVLFVSAVVFFLITNFLLTLLMILKRVHLLLRTEFKRHGHS